MNRLLLACALAACGVPQGAAPEPAPRVDDLSHVTFARRVEAAPAPRPLYAATRTPLARSAHAITSVHGSAISALALTTDGKVAVTSDFTGAVRLWPTLDGTREPVVVAARAPFALAIARDGDAVVIAGLDAVGQLELVRMTGTREDERIAIETPRPLVMVRALGSRFVAVRDDQVIVAFDAHGGLAGELAPEPGERIVTLEVQRDRALAVVVRDRKVRGRWLAIADHVAWGERTARLAIDPARAVKLAPSGTRIAAVSSDGTALQILELASGKVVETLFLGKREQGESNQALGPMAFADDTTLAFVAQFATQVWRDGQLEPFQHRGDLIAGAAGMFVMSEGEALAIETDGTLEYLGYAVAGLSEVIARRDGILATNTTSIVRIDHALHADRQFTLPPVVATKWHIAHLLDERYALVYADQTAWIVDLDSTADPVRLPLDGMFVGYRRETHVLALQATKNYVFAHFDSKTGTFGEPLLVPMTPGVYGQEYLLDPEVAQGHVAAIVEPGDNYTNSPAEVTELRLANDKLDVAGTRWIELAKPFWEDQATVAKAIGNLLQTRQPSPHGDLIAVVDNQRLSLRTSAGVERWSRRLDGTGVVWTPAGELFVYGTGLARVDLETGAFADRQCGWQFGRYPAHTGSFASAALCEANE